MKLWIERHSWGKPHKKTMSHKPEEIKVGCYINNHTTLNELLDTKA